MKIKKTYFVSIFKNVKISLHVCFEMIKMFCVKKNLTIGKVSHLPKRFMYGDCEYHGHDTHEIKRCMARANNIESRYKYRVE